MKWMMLVVTAAALTADVGCGNRNDTTTTTTTGDSTSVADSGSMAMREGRGDTAADAAMHGSMGEQMSSMNTSMTKMLGAADSSYDQRFIDLMVPHHQSAVAMARDAL